jgi:hypothetical protein
MFLYIVQSPSVYLVGHYVPARWQIVTVSTQSTEAAAQALVSYLNGGSAPS